MQEWCCAHDVPGPLSGLGASRRCYASFKVAQIVAGTTGME
jgi:hypothetical protein